MIGCRSESLGWLLLEDLRRHTITADAASTISRTRAVPAPIAIPTNSAVLNSLPLRGLPFVAPFVIGVMLTAAPVEPVAVVGDPPGPPATFVDPADEDGNTKEVEKVDCNGGIATDEELTRLVELVGNGTTGGVDWPTVGNTADGLAELDEGGITVKVVKVVGGGKTTVVVGVSAGGAVVAGGGGGGAAAVVDAVLLVSKGL